MNYSGSNVIIFCGLDGSGKTTQANMLKKTLEKNNFSCKYSWMRYPNFLSLPFAGFLRLFKITVYPLTEKRQNNSFQNLEKHKSLQNIWKKILLLDIKIIHYFKISRILSPEIFIIIDRYVIDTFVELGISTGVISIEKIVEKIKIFLPSNSIIFFIDISPSISYDRNHEESIKILTLKRQIYLDLSNFLKIKIIDGSKTIDEINLEILNTLKLKN